MTYVPPRTSINAYMTGYRLTEMRNLLFSTTNIKIIVQKCSFMKGRKHELELTRSKPQAPSSSFLAFLIVSRPSYIIIHSSFSPKIFRLTDLDINSK